MESGRLMPLVTQPIVRKHYEAQGHTIDDYPVAKDLSERAFLIGCHPGMTGEHAAEIRLVTERYFVENKLMARVTVDHPAGDLWSQAWCAEACAEGQFELTSRELAAWLGGAPHPAFDAFRELLHRCGAIENILEIGCGAGYYFTVTKHVRPEVAFSGVDISSAMISRAIEEYPGGAFAICPAESLFFGESSVDLVILGSVIGCCDDWHKAITEAFRVSRRYVMVHRLAAHDVDGWPDVRETVKEAYHTKMAERIIRESVVLRECEKAGGVLIGEPVRWSQSEDGFQGSYLFEATK